MRRKIAAHTSPTLNRKEIPALVRAMASGRPAARRPRRSNTTSATPKPTTTYPWSGSLSPDMAKSAPETPIATTSATHHPHAYLE